MGVALQNRRALDSMTTKQKMTCIVLGEELCIYVNKSGLVEQDICVLNGHRQDIWECSVPNTPPTGYSNPLEAWLLPLLVPVLAMGARLPLAPSHIQCSKW